MVKRRDQETQDPLPDALVALAASLEGVAEADDVLNRLTQGLADLGVACALFVQDADGPDLRLERATLPLVPDVWGRPLRLPRLNAALTGGRPTSHADIDDAFTETGTGGTRRGLLTRAVGGTLIVAPMRLDRDRGAVLCLTSRALEERAAAAAWELALQVGAGLRRRGPEEQATPTRGGLGEAGDADQSLFHELTRRLSYSLKGEEIVSTGLEVLATALPIGVAVAVSCRGKEDVATVYLPRNAPADQAGSAAKDALDAFVELTGGKHLSCERPPSQTVTLAAEAPPGAADGRLRSVLDAPMVAGGEVTGLLRIGLARPDALDAQKERVFYTVANQISLALEREAAQREAQRAHLASLAESLSDGVVLVDAELRVTSLNEAARQHLSSLGGAVAAEGGALDDPALVDLAREALSSQKPTSLRELPASPASVERRYLMAMAAPLAGSNEGSQAVVILRDVTEERLMQERLLQSEKMVSVGQLVSGVAHELNNPLTGIMGFAQLLLARDLDESTKRDVNTIHTEAERAAKIVQNLLSFARRKKAEKEMANLNVLLERVLELCSYELAVKDIGLELDLDPRLPETMVDANQIQQVFFNIIINAEHAMVGANGHGTLSVRSWREKDVVRLTFHDDGPGMAPETLRRIFDPFFTTKETGEGTGLGLTICYGIMEDHGGRIWAESQPGRGTSFTVELPILEGAQAPSGPEEQPEPAAGGRSFLVVDDEESIRRLLGSILRDDGHHVDTAGNGKEALEHLAHRRYDVIVTDIKMPDMDGRSLYQRLLDTDPELARRTIFITGDTVNPDTRDFLRSVTNPCLPKPFGVREVRETIGQVLAGAE